jgi:hypothetical protein
MRRFDVRKLRFDSVEADAVEEPPDAKDFKLRAGNDI